MDIYEQKKITSNPAHARDQNVYENQGHQYKRILLPIEDGTGHPLQLTADLKGQWESAGETIAVDIEQAVALALIDDNWKEHLRAMDELKDSVQAATFEQKDPLVIYKMEFYRLFEELIYSVNMEVVSYLMRARLVVQNEEVREAREVKTDLPTSKRIKKRKQGKAARKCWQVGGEKNRNFYPPGEKVGRNDLCPCGSGKNTNTVTENDQAGLLHWPYAVKAPFVPEAEIEQLCRKQRKWLCCGLCTSVLCVAGGLNTQWLRRQYLYGGRLPIGLQRYKCQIVRNRNADTLPVPRK